MKCNHHLFVKVSLGVVVSIYLAILYGCIVVQCDPFKSGFTHTITRGRREPGDRLLFFGIIEKENDNKNEKVHEIFQWPDLIGGDNYVISKFQVEDKGEGGKGVLYSGGVDEECVQIYLESQIGKGFKFQIVIYGYEPDNLP